MLLTLQVNILLFPIFPWCFTSFPRGERSEGFRRVAIASEQQLLQLSPIVTPSSFITYNFIVAITKVNYCKIHDNVKDTFAY